MPPPPLTQVSKQRGGGSPTRRQMFTDDGFRADRPVSKPVMWLPSWHLAQHPSAETGMIELQATAADWGGGKLPESTTLLLPLKPGYHNPFRSPTQTKHNPALPFLTRPWGFWLRVNGFQSQNRKTIRSKFNGVPWCVSPPRHVNGCKAKEYIE